MAHTLGPYWALILIPGGASTYNVVLGPWASLQNYQHWKQLRPPLSGRGVVGCLPSTNVIIVAFCHPQLSERGCLVGASSTHRESSEDCGISTLKLFVGISQIFPLTPVGVGGCLSFPVAWALVDRHHQHLDVCRGFPKLGVPFWGATSKW